MLNVKTGHYVWHWRAAGLIGALALVSCASPPPLPISEARAPAVVASGATWQQQLVSGSFSCDLGNKVEIRANPSAGNINVQWKGRNYALLPVASATGALRFEDRSSGLVWIQIPSKSFLLNSVIGQQLANECKAP